jgi:Calcineurin-like phosphoesterase.
MPSYQTLQVRGRTFVVGDLHGCLPQLQSILGQVQFSAANGDVCILLGDLTDRGPDSLGCLNLLDQAGFYAIQGNHEQMCCSAWRHESLAEYCWVRNGGNWFYELSPEQQQTTKAYWLPRLEQLPLAIDLWTADHIHIGICHADPVFNDWAQLLTALDEYTAKKRDGLIEKLIWSRERISLANKTDLLSDAYRIKGVDWCIMGHTPIRPTPFRKGNCIWLDSGAVFSGGYLSVLEVGAELHCHQASQ